MITAQHQKEQGLKDLKWAIGLNQLSLQVMGIWPNERELNEEPASVMLRGPIMILAMFFFLFLPQMYALVLVIRELPLVIDNLLTSCAVFTSCIKLYFLWRSKRVLWPVVDSVTCDWLRPKYSWELKAMKKEAARARLFTISGYFVLGGCYLGFSFAPIFGISIRTVNNITDYGGKLLMVQAYMPYDYSKTPNYEITEVLQILAGLFVAMSVSIPDNYFTALVFHATAQYEILGTKIERFIKADDKSASLPNQTEFNQRIAVFINRHVHLITMVKAIEKSFCFVIIAQVFCMSVMVCCLGFQILGMIGGRGDKPSILQVLTLVGTLFTVMMHTLVDCFASETLAFRSSGVFHNIYNCDWYAIPQHDIRVFIPMMLLSRTPQKLTAGKLFYLSLSTYCSILKSTAGYISMLIAVNR